MRKIICVILVFVLAFSFSACGGNTEKEPETYAPAVEMDLNIIYGDYYDNEMNAEETHIGKRYKITAKATDISEDSVTVTQDIVHPNTIGSFKIDLHFSEDQIEFVKTLSRGNTVTFEGTLTDVQRGNFMDFEDVVFISKVD